MSPQDKVERVLKEIHVLFSKSPTYEGQPDKMIIDRKEFLQLLDRLNNGIFDMMEQYEQTRQSRQNAERSFRRTGNEIIEKANASADDIYAASVIYTADAIGRIRELMDETNDSMNDLFRRFRRELREEKDQLKSHETELEAQLADLADTKKYLAVLQEVNRERERQNRDPEAERAAGRSYARGTFHVGAPADVRVNGEYLKKTGQSAEEPVSESAPVQAEKPDIKINKNAAYFKWKEEQEKTEPGADAEEDTAADGQGKPESDEEASEEPNPDFPDEEAIMRAVLEDERMAEAEREGVSVHGKHGAGGILRTLIFGKDE
ncbi:MAG: hypothetical protein LUE19_01790 [Clostridiales bacterium]|nr:hypothetical protein [Clostridiales bacterium]